MAVRQKTMMYKDLFKFDEEYDACHERMKLILTERSKKNQNYESFDNHISKMTPLLRSLEDFGEKKLSIMEKIITKEKKIKRTKTKLSIRRKLTSRQPRYCHCEKVSRGRMIQCDNDLCPMVWFHFKCVKVNEQPKGKWFCFNCRGKRSNIMKSRKEVIQQLIEFNKKKEEEYEKLAEN